MVGYNTNFRKCSYCGKKFIPAPCHMYKVRGKIQCSYNCYRKEGGDNGIYSNSKLLNSRTETK